MIGSLKVDIKVDNSATSVKLHEIKNKEHGHITFANQAKLEWNAISDGSYYSVKALTSVLMLDFNGMFHHVKLAASHLLFAAVNPVGFVTPSAVTHTFANVARVDSIVVSKPKVKNDNILKIAGVVVAGLVSVLALRYFMGNSVPVSPPLKICFPARLPTGEEAKVVAIFALKAYGLLFGTLVVIVHVGTCAGRLLRR